MTSVLIAVVPLIVACLLAAFAPLSLRQFQGVFILCVAALVACSISGYIDVPLWVIGVCALLGETAHFLSVGALGNRASSDTHKAILAGIGLFPWWWGVFPGAIFVLVFLASVMVYSFGKTLFWSHRLGHTGLNTRIIFSNLSKEDSETFRKNVRMLLAPHLIVAAAIVTVLQLGAVS